MKAWGPLIVGTPPLAQLLLGGAGPVLPPLFLPPLPPPSTSYPVVQGSLPSFQVSEAPN